MEKDKITKCIEMEDFLKQNPKAHIAFQKLSPSHRNEYIKWITEAKREETRQKRLQKMLTMLSEKEQHSDNSANK